jgi:hypothetical protein
VPNVSSFSRLYLKKLETLGTQDEDKHYKNNLEKLETLGTQDEDKHYKNNLEKLETLGTQDDDKHYKNNLKKVVFVFVLCAQCFQFL